MKSLRQKCSFDVIITALPQPLKEAPECLSFLRRIIAHTQTLADATVVSRNTGCVIRWAPSSNMRAM
jgi:hypothetical protein